MDTSFASDVVRIWEQPDGEGSTNLLEIIRKFAAGCSLQADKERSASARWNRSFYFLGAPAAVLATLVGATSGDSFKPAIVTALALVSATLTTLVTFLKSDDKHNQHIRASAAWERLAGEATTLFVSYALTYNRDGNQLTVAALKEYAPMLDYLNQLKGQLMRGEIPVELMGNKPAPDPPTEPTQLKPAS